MFLIRETSRGPMVSKSKDRTVCIADYPIHVLIHEDFEAAEQAIELQLGRQTYSITN